MLQARPRRVAVTGLGVVSCAGIGKDAFWQGILGPAPSGERKVGGFRGEDYFDPKSLGRVDRFAQMAMAAAQLALADAGSIGADPDRSGVWIGTGVGGLETLENQVIVNHERGSRRVTPFLVPMIMCNAGAGSVSIRLGWRGPCETTVTACAAGTHSVGNAARLVASGRCEVMLAGASEAPMTPVGMAGFKNMTALSRSGISRPFDSGRDGFVIAEGAAVVVLEDMDRALARSAHVYAEVLGAASTADAYHITAPSPGGSGAAACMELALADAGLQPADVAHINAHGTSTPLNDRAEADAITKVFGAPGPPVTSIKGVIGHSLGAAGAIEAVACALTIDKGLIPPTAGLVDQDPEIGLDVVTGEPRRFTPGPVLSNSFGFGGHNGCLVMGPPPA
ncbi:MAG: beta-ketoacyl-[acyl-carrier-protein] synthase family protein [Acidimicrobiales bacterium]